MQNPHPTTRGRPTCLSPRPFYFQRAPSLLIRAPSWQTTLWLAQMTVTPDSQSRHSPGFSVKTASQTWRSPRAPSPRRPPAQQRPEHRPLAAQKFQPSTQECGNISHSEVRGERKQFSAFHSRWKVEFFRFWNGHRMFSVVLMVTLIFKA